MPLIDTYRTTLKRENEKASNAQANIARCTKERATKMAEFGRTKQESRLRTLANQIQTLDKKLVVEYDTLAKSSVRAAEYSQKVLKEQQSIDKKAEREAEKASQQISQSQRDLASLVESQGAAVVGMNARIGTIEAAVLRQARAAVAADPVDREFDIFLSHTHSDADVAADLYLELTDRGLAVWFDGAELVLGLSLSEQIDKGMTRSRIAVMLVTPAFLEGRYWIEREMYGFFSSRKRVIPVMDGVTHEEVLVYSTLLGDRFGLSTADYGFDEISDRLLVTTRPESLSQ